MRRSSLLIVMLGIFIGASLTSCDSDNGKRELKRYVNKVKARRSTQIEPMPEVKKNKQFEYPNIKRRNPFKPVSKEVQQSASGPDQNRPKQPLENYMLDSLKMVGSLERDKKVWAIIAAPDGLFYRVTAGNYIGQNYGKIERISDKELTLNETFQRDGVWEKRSAKIKLVEGN